MGEPPLAALRERVETLASDDGTFYVICGRTGARPTPVAGARFDDRATACRAVRATERYRAALRRYDPQVPRYDPIVCQDTGLAPEPRTGRATAHATTGGSAPSDGRRREPDSPGGEQ